MRLIKVIFLACLLASGCEATSIIFPAFTEPIIKKGFLVALSPDRKRLVALDAKGTLKWERRLDEPSSLVERQDGKLWILTGNAVSILNIVDGSLQPQFTVPNVSWLRYERKADILFGAPAKNDFREQTGLTVFQAATGAVLFSVEQGEAIAYADSDIIVVASGERKNVDQGYTYARGWIEGFRPSNRKQEWRAELTGRPDPYHSVARVRNWLVFEDGTDWLLVDLNDGQIRRALIEKGSDVFGPSGLREENGHLAFTTGQLNMKNFSRSEHTISVVSIPDLKVISQKKVEVIEAVHSEKWGEFLITDALYRTACFRQDGTKIWEHFQMHRTSPIDGVIYFSDYSEGRARIGSIEVATGKENILFSEAVKFP
jgi:hypothetical protein